MIYVCGKCGRRFADEENCSACEKSHVSVATAVPIAYCMGNPLPYRFRIVLADGKTYTAVAEKANDDCYKRVINDRELANWQKKIMQFAEGVPGGVPWT